jgi:hypothetical protein
MKQTIFWALIDFQTLRKALLFGSFKLKTMTRIFWNKIKPGWIRTFWICIFIRNQKMSLCWTIPINFQLVIFEMTLFYFQTICDFLWAQIFVKVFLSLFWPQENANVFLLSVNNIFETSVAIIYETGSKNTRPFHLS